MSLKIGVKYGIVKRIIRRLDGLLGKEQKKLLEGDMKHAGEELLDYLAVLEPETLKEFVKGVEDWLSFQAMETGYKPTKYLIGEGENIFKKIVLERALYYKKLDKKKV